MRDNNVCRNGKIGCYACRHYGIIFYQKLGLIAPRVIFIRGFIDFINFSGRVQRWVLDLLKINIVFIFVKLIGMFSPLLSMHLPVELIFVLVFFLVSWYHSTPILMYDLIENYTFSCFCCRLEFNGNIHFKQLFCTGYIHARNRIFWKVMVCYKNNNLPHFLS